MSCRVLGVCFCVLMSPLIVLAQAGGVAPAPAPGVRAGAGAVDPAQFRQKMLDTIKDKLEATDEQWEALSPKIEKVLDAKRNAGTGAGMSWSSATPGGRAMTSTGGGNVETAPGKAMQEVRAAIDDKDTPAEEITKKLAVMREARDKARAELDAAQKELKAACTPRQEAILVTLGQLE